MAKKKARKKRAKHILRDRRKKPASKKRQVKKKTGKGKARAVRRPRNKPRHRAPEKILWRITVASPYYIRARGKRKRKTGSPASAAFMVRAWYERKLDAIAERHKLKAKAEKGRDIEVSKNKRAFSKGEKPDIEIKAVRYEAQLIGIIEETNEK